jgi:hypothetical protein
VLVASAALVACSHPQPAVAPGPVIAADPSVSLRSMEVECDAMVTALAAWRTCPNLDDTDRQDLDFWIERAQQDFAAGRKAKPEANAQQAIALACFRATRSVEAAAERCHAGPPPKDAWYGRQGDLR